MLILLIDVICRHNRYKSNRKNFKSKDQNFKISKISDKCLWWNSEVGLSGEIANMVRENFETKIGTPKIIIATDKYERPYIVSRGLVAPRSPHPGLVLTNR